MEDADLCFFFYESKESASRKITVKAKGTAEEWDANTGVASSIKHRAMTPCKSLLHSILMKRSLPSFVVEMYSHY